jgi:hypothetical protein
LAGLFDVQDVSTRLREGHTRLPRNRDALKIRDLPVQGEKPGHSERNADHSAREHAACDPVPPPRRTDRRVGGTAWLPT